MKPKLLFTLLMQLCIAFICSAQCPGSITTTTPTVVAATCPSNGRITVNSNVSGISSATYQIISGPAGGGWPTSTQSSNIFSSLPAGAYTIRISCGATTNTVTATVPNNYTAPTISAVVSNTCNNYTPGGTITVNGGGSSTPLRYAVLQSANASEPDANFNYVNTNTFNVSSFGTYQVRVKDNCNNFVTQTVEVKPSEPAARLAPYRYTYNTCTTNYIDFSLANVATNTNINLDAVNYKLEVWESATTGCPGTTPAGTPSQTKFIRTWGDANITININTRSLYYRITSICGEVTNACLDIPAFNFYAAARVFLGCGTGATNSLAIETNGFANYSLSVTGYNASNQVLFTRNYAAQSSSIFTGLQAAHHYTYTFTDGCGRTSSATINTPTPGMTAFDWTDYGTWCTNVLGTGVFSVHLGNNYIPGYANMALSNIQLVNTQSGTAYQAVEFADDNTTIRFPNVPPGSYTVRFTAPSGGCVTNIPVTVSGTTFSAVFNGTSNQLCGGTGSINVSITTNSTGAASFSLRDASGNEIANNTSGTFTNLPAGNYTVIATMATACLPTVGFYQASRSFVIAPAGGGPLVVKKYGIVCDNASTGVAGFTFSGAGPFVLEMKKSSEVNYTTITTQAPNDYLVNNLTPNETYNLRITDQCGTTSTTDVTISPLNNISKLTTVHPCVGQAYTLSVESIPGATYSWSYNGGASISTSPDIFFSSYNATSDGTYVCTVTIGGCITRTVSYTLNSNYCGAGLPVRFGNIDAYIKNGRLFVDWTSLAEINNVLYEVEISRDGKVFEKIGTVKSTALNGNSDKEIKYNFEIPLTDAVKLAGIALFAMLLAFKQKRKVQTIITCFAIIVMLFLSCNKNKNEVDLQDGSTFVRITTVDVDGNKGYSKIIKVKND